MEIEKLLQKCKENHLDTKLIREAFDYAKGIHKGQKRKSGEDYMTHPFEVAKILTEIGADEDLIIAALLHDTLEEGRGQRYNHKNDPRKIRKQHLFHGKGPVEGY